MSSAPLFADRDTSQGWIESPFYDSIFFMAAPILGTLYVLMQLRFPHVRLIPGVFFTIGMAHYLSTFSFYLGDDNRAHYLSHRMAFFVGPVALIVAAGVMRFTAALPYLLTIIYLWNAWHVSLQSCGILSVYRHLGRGPHDEKRFANALLLSVTGALVASNINGFEPLRVFLRRISPALPALIFDVASIVALVAGGMYVYRVFERSRSGNPVRATEAMFLVSSVLLFLPFLWASNAGDATNGVLFGHFVQYLALVWLLHRRKYLPGTGSYAQRSLAFLSRNMIALGSLMLTLAVVMYLLGKRSESFGVYAWLFNALVLTHFYLDGWIWAFKRPYVRQSLGPYLSKPLVATPRPASLVAAPQMVK